MTSQTGDEWETTLNTIEINSYLTSRTCDVLICAERYSEYSPLMERFTFGSLIDDRNEVKCLTFANLTADIQKAAGQVAPVPVISVAEKLFRGAALNFFNAFENSEAIPVSAVTRLIKIQILRMMEYDVFLEKRNLYHIQQLAASRLALVEAAGDKGKGKGKGKGKDKGKGKGKDKKKDKGGKKGAKGKETVDPCLKWAKLDTKYGSKLKKRKPEPTKLQLDKIQVPYKHLFIVIVGFFEPDLMQALISLDIPIMCVLEIGQPSKEVNELSKRTTEFERSLQFYVGPKTVTQDSSNAKSKTPSTMTISTLSESTTSSSKSESTSTTINTSQSGYEVALKFFWDKMYILLQSDYQYSFLKDTFHMRFVAGDLLDLLSKTDDEEYKFEKESIKCFQDISAFIRQLPDVQRQYATYMRYIKLWDLGPEPTQLMISCLLTYRRMMDRLPPECFTVALLLHCLIEEVCVRIDGCDSSSYISEKSIKPESTLYKESSVPMPIPKYFYSDSARSQLLTVITKYSRIGETKQVTSVNYANYFPKTTVELNSRPFRVHEDNALEIMINSYNKKLARILFDINMKPLVTLQPVNLLNSIINEKKKEYENSVSVWSKEMGISVDDLNNIINMWIFIRNKLTVQECESIDKEILNFLMKFPKRTNDEYLESRKIYIKHSKHYTEKEEAGAGDACEESQTSSTTSQETIDVKFLDIKYLEYNNNSVMLQQIMEAYNEFQSMDQEYVYLTDSLVLHFHDNFDNIGSYTQVFDQSIRTPLCIRDFCRFVTHEDTKWIRNKEDAYQNELTAKRLLREQKPPVFGPPGDLTTLEYIQPGSLKEALLISQTEKKTDKKGGKGSAKGSKGSAKGGKGGKGGKGKGGKGGKGGKDNLLPYFKQLEAIKPPPPPDPRLSIRTAYPDESSDFIGYDLAKTRVQLTGSITTLKSEDGIRAIIDQTRWLGGNKNTSIKINALGHLLVLHILENYISNPMLFHMYLSDHTIIAFQKPEEKVNVQTALCERICRSIAEQKQTGIKKPRQNIYCISEKYNFITKAINIPIIMERNIIMTESSVKPFIDQLRSMKIKHRIIPDELSTNKIEEEEIIEEETITKVDEPFANSPVQEEEQEEEVEMSDICRKFEKLNTPHLKVIDPIGSVPLEALEEEEKEEEQPTEPLKRPVNDEEIIFPKRLKNNEFLKEIKIASEKNYPMFKICSSPLHKYEYVKRVKSYLEIPTASAVRRILLASPCPKPRATIEVSKCYPIVMSENDDRSIKSQYEVKLSLLSGLMVSTIPGFDQAPFQVKQYYIEKGSLCTSVIHEEYRIFHEGNIIIKKCDGNFVVLNVGGTITDFEVPYFKKRENVRFLPRRKKQPSCHNNRIPLHSCTQSLTKMQRLTYKSILRRQKHVIDSFESRLYRSRKALARSEKHKIEQNKFYFIHEEAESFSDFKILTPDGKQIKVKSQKIFKCRKFHSFRETDYNTEEMILEREDGMISLLNRDTVLVTQFPDGTRIKTTVIVESKLVTVSDEEECLPPPLIGCDQNTKVKVTPKEDPRWVLLSLQYEYEHPCYAKVTYTNSDNSTTIELPNNVLLHCDKLGKFSVDINGKVKTEFSNKKFQVRSKPCQQCSCECVCTMNVKPLYFSTNFSSGQEILRLIDSHGKKFMVKFDEDYMKILGKVETATNPLHCEHDFTEKEKMFVLKQNLTGCKYWDSKLMMRYKMNNNNDRKMMIYSDNDNKTIRCLKFITRMEDNYMDRFLRPYTTPQIWLTKDRPSPMSVEKFAYVTYRLVNVLPPLKKVELLYSTIETVIDQFYEHDKYLKFILVILRMMSTQDNMAYLEDIKRIIENETKKRGDEKVKISKEGSVFNRFKTLKKFTSKLRLCDLNFDTPLDSDVEKYDDEFRQYFLNATCLYEKWYVWHHRTKSYWSKIRDLTVPGYFQYRYCPYPPPPKPCKPRQAKYFREEEIRTVYEIKTNANIKQNFDVDFNSPFKGSAKVSNKSKSEILKPSEVKPDTNKINKSDSSLLKTKSQRTSVKPKSGSPRNKYNHSASENQQVIICNMLTVDPTPNFTMHSCKDSKVVPEIAQEEETSAKSQRPCFVQDFCDVGHLNKINETCDKQTSVSLNDEKCNDNEVACEMMAVLRKAIEDERRELQSSDPRNPEKCFFMRASKIPKIITTFLSERVNMKEDVHLSYSKASLLQEILMEISKLSMTDAELEIFLQTIDKEFKSLLEYQQASTDELTDSPKKTMDREESIKQVTYEFKSTMERRVSESRDDYISILPSTVSVDNVSAVKGSKSQLNNIYSGALMEISPSMRLFHDKSLFGRIVSDTDTLQLENLKPLNAMFKDKPQRDYRTNKVPLIKVLSKSPSILQMILAGEEVTAEEEGEKMDNYSIPSETTGQADELYMPKPFVEYKSSSSQQISSMSVDSVGRTRKKSSDRSQSRFRSSSLKVQIPTEEGYFNKKSESVMDFESLEDLIHVVLPPTDKQSDNLVKKIGGVHGKITDKEVDFDMGMKTKLSENRILSVKRGRFQESILRESLGTQTQLGKQDSEVQNPE